MAANCGGSRGASSAAGSINGMLYLRGHSLEYDQWAQLGCHGWSFDQVLPYFKKAETNTQGANEWHGDSGPITVKPSRVDLPICEAFLAAAGEAGFSVVDDLNADIAEGFGRFDTNIANGRRASTAVAYVQPARRRGNLELLSEAIAARIVIDGSRARGVEIVKDGGPRDDLGGARDHPVRGYCQLAPAFDAVGYRASRSSLSLRDSGRGQCAGGWPQSSEPPLLRASLCVLAASDRLQIHEPAGGARNRTAVCVIARRYPRRELCRDWWIHAQRSGSRGLRHDCRHGAGADHPWRGRVFGSPICSPSAMASQLWSAQAVPLAAAGSCCAATIRPRIRGSSLSTLPNRKICKRSRARCAACAT